MSGYCVCTHGYGQHQSWDSVLYVAEGKVEFFEDARELPNFCCHRNCSCRKFREEISRWGLRQPESRKYCWLTPLGPLCGKPGRAREDVAKWTPSRYRRCAACSRIVAAEGLAIPNT